VNELKFNLNIFKRLGEEEIKQNSFPLLEEKNYFIKNLLI